MCRCWSPPAARCCWGSCGFARLFNSTREAAMLADVPLYSMGVFLGVFLAICCAAYFLFWRNYGDDARGIARLRGLAHDGELAPQSTWTDWTRSALPRLGEMVQPGRPDRLARLKADLGQAGLYQPSAVKVFWGVK